MERMVSMKLKIKILLKNKDVKQIGIDPDSKNFSYNGGIYVVKDDLIRYNSKNEAELFYFENNPTPLNIDEKDDSSDYLDYFIKNNFIEQVSDQWSQGKGLGSLLKAFFSNPQYIMIVIMAAAVIYSILTSGGKII